MAENRVLYAFQDNRCFLKLVGEAKYSTTGGFDRFINDLFERGEVEDVLVDLSETTYIDSTNLGELTKISTFLMQLRRRRPTLVSTQLSINATILDLGLDRVFHLVTEPAKSGIRMSLVAGGQAGEKENALRILEAHRYLSSLNDKNGRVFRSVVDAFERELGDEAPRFPVDEEGVGN